jgi:hypothetical protein
METEVGKQAPQNKRKRHTQKENKRRKERPTH